MGQLARRRSAAQHHDGSMTAIRELAAKIGTPPTGWKAPDLPADYCTDCDNTKWMQVDGGGVKRCPACLSRARGQAPGIPQEEHGSRLATFKETPQNRNALTEARLFLEGVHPNIYLFGGVGTGKTRLACSLLNELHSQFTTVEFVRVPKLLVTLLPGAESLDDLIERIAAVPVICLDDVGASQASDFARRMLLVIYEARGDRGHRTIWTSNLDLGELQEFTGDDRLPSRIAGGAKVVELAGKDWRLMKTGPRR